MLSHWSRHIPHGAALEKAWNAKFAEYERKYAEEAAELKSIITGELPAGWAEALPVNISSMFFFYHQSSTIHNRYYIRHDETYDFNFYARFAEIYS